MSPDIWSLETVLDFMNRHGFTIRVSGGKPELDFPEGRGDVARELAPHLRARREEVLSHFQIDMKASPTVLTTVSEVERVRAELVVKTIKRAGGRRVWHLLPTGLAEPTKTRPPPEAKYVCVEGDPEWLVLPTVNHARDNV